MKNKTVVAVTMVIITLIVGITGVFVYVDQEDRKYKESRMNENPGNINNTEPAGTPEVTPDAVPAYAQANPTERPVQNGKIIVLDPGHGKSSDMMSNSDKKSAGYQYSYEYDGWGEWRHYKDGTFGTDCNGGDCTGTGPSCWYPMGNGDRETEPEIDLNNALAAQKYLEEMGYTVRLTRSSNNENPSMNRRVSHCFPDNNISADPDASLYVCLHSNASDGAGLSGTSYIALSGDYKQGHIGGDFKESSNNAGRIINSKIAEATGLSDRGAIEGMEYLILFNKCPVPIAYMEIGFFDNSSDLEILRTQSDSIGKAVAEGVNEFLGGAN